MLISHENKFIFLHCRKAAGTAVTVSLARYLGPNDLQIGGIGASSSYGIYPPKQMLKEAIRYPAIGQTLKSIRRSKTLERAFWSYVNRAIKLRYGKLLGSEPQHAPAEKVAKAFPEEWGNYYKFCIIRNPWIQVVSDYYNQIRLLDSPPSFAEFVGSLRSDSAPEGGGPDKRFNWSIYTIKDEVAVDATLKYEELHLGLDFATRAIGLPWDGWLPHANPRSLTEGAERDHRALYGKREIEVVSDLFAKEIELGGYEF